MTGVSGFLCAKLPVPAQGFLRKATTVFADPMSITIRDPDHSRRELRFVDVGLSRSGRLLVAAYTERGNRIRLIGARIATAREKRECEEDA